MSRGAPSHVTIRHRSRSRCLVSWPSLVMRRLMVTFSFPMCQGLVLL